MKSTFTIHLGSPPSNPRLDEHDRVSAIHKEPELVPPPEGAGSPLEAIQQ